MQVLKYYNCSLYIFKKKFYLKDIMADKKSIEKGKQSYYTKSHFWFNDKSI